MRRGQLTGPNGSLFQGLGAQDIPPPLSEHRVELGDRTGLRHRWGQREIKDPGLCSQRASAPATMGA